LPVYVIEPPDILTIDAVSIVPRGPHVVSPLDVVMIQVTPTFPDRPITGPLQVDSAGLLNLGSGYGSVRIAGMKSEEAALEIEKFLAASLQKPVVTLNVVQTAANQQIAGDHLVGPDGTVNLGTYGRVFVTGMSVDQARIAIETHLSQYLEKPQIAVDVAGYNSKTYYIITEGAGFGDGVNRFPITGNDTVLDAISKMHGLSQVSSKKIWVARPSPSPTACDQILPVDWVAVTKGGSSATNYQLMPGDRVFVAEDHLIATDTMIGKILSPMERIFGFTLLGTTTVQAINRFPKGYLTPPNAAVVVP
jgi:polysaccharide export outer membrane protein